MDLPLVARAKLIFQTTAPEDFGLLKSQVIFTYGQQTMIELTVVISPLIKKSFEVVAAPSLALTVPKS